jgi:hypothetical protein
MSSDNQPSSEDLRGMLLAKLEAARSVDELRDLLREIEQGRDAIGLGAAAELARMALVAISSLTVDAPEVATDVICEHLLPWCLTAEDQSGESSQFDMEGYQLRDLLKEWVYQYPQAQMLIIRSQVLRDVRKKLEIGPTKELLWVVSAIGFRTSEITEILWPLLERKGGLADTVLGTLAGLGATPDERDRLLDVVHDRLSSGELSRGILVAVQELVGPHRIGLAIDLLKLAVEKYPAEDHHDFALAVSTVTRAVHRCTQDQTIHDDVWSILRNHFKTVRTTSKYAYRCDTKGTVMDFVHWLLTKETGSNWDTGAYIMLSRLSELTKPRQLAGWDEVATDELTALLERVATKDTKNKSQFATTEFRLKTEAWEFALTVGCSSVEDWINAAIMEETNPYVAYDVAKIVSCLSVQRLPDRLSNAIVAAETTDDENGHLFRQMGLIEIARSSCSREAFDALLHFGLMHKGSVLLSTIDAIIDVAIVRMQEGDADTIDKILKMTTVGNEKRHREAAISAFCWLCSRGFVRGEPLKRLWEFANADDLDSYSHCEAMEAIGVTDFEQAYDWSDAIRQIAVRDDSDVGWRAWEVLIRRDWLTADDEPRLLSRLGLVETDPEIGVRDAATATGWQTFLIGLLFRNDRNRYGGAMSDVLVHSPTDAVYQILDSLRHHGDGCPDSVSMSLARRIRALNDRASTDTEFFHLLAVIAPSRLLTVSNVYSWTEWRVEARTALCEAIRTVATKRDDYRSEAVVCLVAFMRDASFQVRRAAYRAVAQAAVPILESICTTWSQSTDVELRKRAAEAVAWLPISSHSDETISNFGFAWDAERSVREIWNDVLSDRRQRLWANEYLDRILLSCANTDESVLAAYRYARALSKIGDDESVKRIDEFLATDELRPNVEHWLKKIAHEIKENWKKVTVKWPEPWSHEHGTIEELEGAIVLSNGTRLNARLSLWCRYRSGPSDLSAWGGIAEEVEDRFPMHVDEDQIELQIPGRPSASANVFGSHWRSGAKTRLVLRGNSPYPAPPRVPKTEGDKSLVEIVTDIIHETGVEFSAKDAEEASQRLQPLLERADVSLFNLPSESDTAFRIKVACQEAALVTRTMADSLPPTFLSSVALWRIANSILERESVALRLSPAELNSFGVASRQGERESPDELLFWMMDRVESREPNDANRQSHAAKSK